MGQTSAPEPDSTVTIVNGLQGAASRSADENLSRIEEALNRAAGQRAGTTPTAEVDRALVSALIESPRADTILERLEPDSLAALVERCTEHLASAGAEPDPALRRLAWDLLDQIRRPVVLRRIDPSQHEEWSRRILTLVERSHLTVGPLFRHRAESYAPKVLFELPSTGGIRTLTWRQVAGRVEMLARGLLSLDPEGEPGPVAIISENRLEMALIDLACLTSGIVNILIPANSTESDIRYMLRHGRARTAVFSDRDLLRRVLDGRDELPELRWIVDLEARFPSPEGAISLDSLAARASDVPASLIQERSESVKIDDLASVMYTSGTTGAPKGIRFSHRNIVFKRIARALAIPEIGEDDVFLCYLPLYHTFGRYLELLGCVFWGSTYCFLENPSVEALVRGMRLYRPTVFISVPKKWIQLYEAITARADPMKAPDEELREATRQVTGGRLRWGLSAAGHLDAEIFRFFQRNGVELMSGFGMTEATGGITMTPPGRYKDDSLGGALPGIELRVEEDGELLVRGPYVMVGYLDPPEGESALDEDGWLRTGDLMETDGDGFLRLVDRKKEIYKNIKGETIAPQRVENLVRDFESARRVFLVGDHRPYNTVLIYPNPEYEELDFGTLSPEETRDHFRSIVISVNKFLSPFERIVDFALIDRDLDPDREELTPKGTPRRAVVERNFAETIQLLYQRTNLQVGRIELTFPNWLFQALGLTAQDIRVAEDKIVIPSSGKSLTLRRRGRRLAQVGSCIYRYQNGPLNLGALLTSSRLWLGNEELVEFVSLDLPSLERPGRQQELEWRGRPKRFQLRPDQADALRSSLGKPDPGLMDLHLAALVLASDSEEAAVGAVRLLEKVVAQKKGPLVEPARLLLARTAVASPADVRRRAFQVLVPSERESRFKGTLHRFLAAPGTLLVSKIRRTIVKQDLSEARLEAFISAAHETSQRPIASREGDRRAVSLLRLLTEYGSAHPARYRRLRAFLVRTMLFAARQQARKEAARCVEALTLGFRKWLGPSARIAVNEETGKEYGWEDVVAFDEEVEQQDRERLLWTLKNTSMLREGAFLFSGGATIRLEDIPPGGIWIRLLGSRHGKSVYRITVQTYHQGSYDLAVNVNHSLTGEQVQEETHWLILCGDARDRDPLVEDFGGYWERPDLWTEEFIAGETLERVMKRLSRKDEEEDRFRQMWPFLAWATLSAYVDFWNRTGRQWEVADAGMTNVVVPTRDYQTGTRIVSVSNRRPHEGLIPMLRGMREEFVKPAEERYPVLKGLAQWNTIFDSVLEVCGETEGLALFREVLEEEQQHLPDELRRALERYVADVERAGFQPMRLFFATRRYLRWAGLSAEHTPQARARTLQELYETYGLEKLLAAHPEVRVRFFRETVLRNTPPALAEGLEQLIGKLRRRELNGDELIDAIAELRSKLELGPDEDYFLARLSFPYLRPEDAAGFVLADAGGRQASEIVVQLEDHEGNMFRVRHAMNPKEVGRLHRLFLAAKLDVRFRPEHQYLVALNDRMQIIGGIYYDVEEGGESAHLEKIVVAEPFRKKGVADGLMKEFFNRLKTAGVKTVTTGFFRPEYFYAHGFKIEKRYAGLVKSLDDN